MNSTKSKLFIVLAFLTLTLSSVSCKENSLAGRVYACKQYKGMYKGSQIIVVFGKGETGSFIVNSNDGLEVESFSYKTEGKDVVILKSEDSSDEVKCKYDDESLLYDYEYITAENFLMLERDGHEKNGIISLQTEGSLCLTSTINNYY